MKNFLILLSLCFILASGIFMYKGFDYKNNYYSDEISSLNKNAYVGGDAYNYIINGTYFTAYMVISSATLISGVMCFVGGNLIKEEKLLN